MSDWVHHVAHEDRLSDASYESSHSVPPRLALRYNDGRPDVIIPHIPNLPDLRRSGSHKRPSSRNGHGHSFDAHSHRSAKRAPPESYLPSQPEEIMVLPSNPLPAGARPPRHVRSRSLPRDAFQPIQHDEFPPQLGPRIISQPIQTPMNGQPSPIAPRSPALYGHQNGETSQYYGHYNERPRSSSQKQPSVMYAPVHYAQQSRHQAPVMYSHPHQVGPNGVVYSHSAPIPATQYPSQSGPYPSSVPPPATERHGDSRSRRHRSRTRSYSHHHHKGPSHATNGGESDVESANAYYAASNGRQKAHGTNTPELSMYASSVSTKSPTTPVSVTHKKPFFQRLFGFGSSAGSSKGSNHGQSKRIHRRHSMERL